MSSAQLLEGARAATRVERFHRPHQPRHAHTGIVHTLHPGDVARGTAGDRLETLLGSCVAVILTDPRRTVGVMCHIVHTGAMSNRLPKTSAHADVAFQTMHRLLLEFGITPSLCEAYVYGGGNMFPSQPNAPVDVGRDNARWVIDTLAETGIQVLYQDVGGTAYRRLSWMVSPDAPSVTSVQVDEVTP